MTGFLHAGLSTIFLRFIHVDSEGESCSYKHRKEMNAVAVKSLASAELSVIHHKILHLQPH